MIRNLLVLPSGEELFSGAVGENAISSVSLTSCVNAEEDLTPGAVCASMLEMTVIAPKSIGINAGDEVTLYTVLEDGARKQEGIFVAEKPEWKGNDHYVLTAFDRVSLLDKDLSGWLGNLSGWPYKLLDFAGMVCAQCGTELKNTEIPNGDYPVQMFSAEGITGRQLMQWAGEIAGRFCRADADGMIEFSWYTETGKTIGICQEGELSKAAAAVTLNNLPAGAPIQAQSMISTTLYGQKSVTLRHIGRNILDLQTAGIYHSNYYSQLRHNMTITNTGIRLDIIKGTNMQDRSLWGFCIGTRKELTGKKLTLSANPSWSRTDTYAVPYLGFFGVNYEPLVSPRENISSALGGYLSSGDYQQLAIAKAADHSSVSYTVTGKENCEYIAVLFTFCTPNRGASTIGDWTQWDNIQVEYGSEPSAYQKYCLKEYTRTFETVYGGELDWSTGALTVTHGKIQSYDGEAVPDGWSSNTGTLSPGAQVIYPLEKPYIISLAPQKISAVEGINKLWADSGNTIAGYKRGYYFENSLSFEDYCPAPVEKVQIRLTETDVGVVYPDDPQASNAYVLAGNYLLSGGDGETLKGIAQRLYEQLEAVNYTPCRLDVPAQEGVQCGDVITVVDSRENSMKVYVMRKVRSGQKDRLECTGNPRRDSSFAVNQQSYQALSGKVLELKTEVEGLQAENRDARGNLSKLELTVEGITTQVKRQDTDRENLEERISQLQQTARNISISVQSLTENGASKVRTQMGYTFDDEGLRISRSDAEMTNLLDNTGMYVRRGADLVLQANNDGVEAVNITVRNYLNVGENARFEDYNDGSNTRRTACFFTGG